MVRRHATGLPCPRAGAAGRSPERLDARQGRLPLAASVDEAARSGDNASQRRATHALLTRAAHRQPRGVYADLARVEMLSMASLDARWAAERLPWRSTGRRTAAPLAATVLVAFQLAARRDREAGPVDVMAAVEPVAVIAGRASRRSMGAAALGGRAASTLDAR